MAARLPTCHCHWRRVGSRAAARTGNIVDLAWLLSFFLSSPAVKITVTCKHKKTHTAVHFTFSFLSKSAFFLLHFRSASGLFWICCVADRLLLFILFSSVSCTGGEECWKRLELRVQPCFGEELLRFSFGRGGRVDRGGSGAGRCVRAG